MVVDIYWGEAGEGESPKKLHCKEFLLKTKSEYEEKVRHSPGREEVRDGRHPPTLWSHRSLILYEHGEDWMGRWEHPLRCQFR